MIVTWASELNRLRGYLLRIKIMAAADFTDFSTEAARLKSFVRHFPSLVQTLFPFACPKYFFRYFCRSFAPYSKMDFPPGGKFALYCFVKSKK